MYTLTILVKEKIDEKGRTGLIDDVKKNFSKIINEELWGVRGLAYSIKHNDKAFYAHFNFEAEPEKIIDIDRGLRLNEDVLRYLLTKNKKVKIRKGKAKVQAKPEGESVKPESDTENKEEKVSKKQIVAKK